MAELPVLPVATAALIADTVHMSAEQFGAYVRILMAMWARGAELRDDEAELARIAGVTLKRFRAIRDVVMEPISSVDGMLHQKRLSQTWDDVQKIRVKRTSASNERWRQERVRNAHGHAHAHANGHPHASPRAMHMQSNSKLKDNITTTSSVAAREEPDETPTAPEQAADPAGLAQKAREAVQKTTGIASGELAQTLQVKGWVR